MGQLTQQEIHKALKDPKSFFDILLFNNPSSVLSSLRSMNATNKAIPTVETISPDLLRFVNRNNRSEFAQFVNSFEWNPNANNWTTKPALWASIGLSNGDVAGYYNQLFSN